MKELNLIVKADVQGSVEVLSETLRKLSTSEVKVNVIHTSVGAISTNDVMLATASDAIVIGFNVRPERNAAELAEKEGVDIRMYTVIYTLVDEMKAAMTGLLDPKFQEVFQGRAEVRDTFKVPKVGVIAGCMVTDGIIPRTASIRLLRDNRVILRRQDRLAPPLQERRRRSPPGLRVRHRHREVPGRQGRRRDRSLQDREAGGGAGITAS